MATGSSQIVVALEAGACLHDAAWTMGGGHRTYHHGNIRCVSPVFLPNLQVT